MREKKKFWKEKKFFFLFFVEQPYFIAMSYEPWGWIINESPFFPIHFLCLSIVSDNIDNMAAHKITALRKKNERATQDARGKKAKKEII